jgi:hypothetical protein
MNMPKIKIKPEILSKIVEYISIIMIICGIALAVNYFLPGHTTISIKMEGR